MLFDFDKSFMVVLDSVESSVCVVLVIVLYECLLEDLIIIGGVFDGSVNFLFRSIGAYDMVLMGYLVLGVFVELWFDLLVLLNGGFEVMVDVINLGVVFGVWCIGVGFDFVNMVGEGMVESYGFGGEGVELVVGLVGGRVVGIV